MKEACKMVLYIEINTLASLPNIERSCILKTKASLAGSCITYFETNVTV